MDIEFLNKLGLLELLIIEKNMRRDFREIVDHCYVESAEEITLQQQIDCLYYKPICSKSDEEALWV
ncbi:MAG: hypothetical protein GQ532_19140 [Methylomarinum sp.]|nr:hypothetical protein [Methylomarinum sp.]